MKILFLLFFVITFTFSKNLEKVSIQLQWLDQFQFAGYYIAKEKGFYEDVGLDVNIKKFDYNISSANEVISKNADFGVGRSSLIIDKSNGKDIVLVSAIFQSSPMILLGLESLEMEDFKDILNKKIMLTKDAGSTASIRAMFKSFGINEKDLNIIPHTFNLQDLIDGKTDLMSSYISNEPFRLKEKNIKYKIIDPKDYGYDFYNDFLFTSQEFIDKNPTIAEKFRKASLKGWEYAFDNIPQSVEILFNKYNAQQNKTKEMLMFEAYELKKLAYYETDILGSISKEKLRRTKDVFRLTGVLKNDINVNEIIYNPLNKFSKEQEKYLDSKGDIKVCIEPFWEPIEFIDSGRYEGLTSDFLSQFSKMIGKRVVLIPTKSWNQSLEFIQQRKCDMLPAALKTLGRQKYLDFTTTYLSFPNVIVTGLDAPYIYDLKLLKNKKIGVVKGYAYVEDFKKKYLNIDFIEFNNINEGLEALNNNEIYAFIDIAATIGHMILEKNYVHLKISGQLDEQLNLRVATRNDEPQLNTIMQYCIDNLDLSIKNKIINKWQTINVEEKTDHDLIRKIVIFFIVVLVLFFIGFHKLKRSKELAEESYENIERLLNTTMEGVCVTDKNFNIFIINKSALDIFGYKKDEFLKLSLFDTVAPYELNRVKKGVEDSVVKYEVDMIKKDGSIFPGLVSGKDIIHKGKKARISTVIDLSALKKAQEDLKKLNEELEKKVNEEVKKNVEKEKLIFQHSRQAQMGELISMIAHQWRQPLSTISLTIIASKLKIDLNKFDLDSKNGIDEFISYLKKQFDDILLTVGNLSSIIDDFRVFYKPDKKTVSINVNEVINKSLNIIELALRYDNIELIKNLSCDCKLEIYDNELMQVFLNIIKNAQDNFKTKDIDNKKIFISTYCEVSNLIIDIEDNGGGIPKDILPNIFDPYFSTKDEKNGTGLGLYMTRIIIEEHHNGKLEVKNTQSGVKFRIVLKR